MQARGSSISAVTLWKFSSAIKKTPKCQYITWSAPVTVRMIWFVTNPQYKQKLHCNQLTSCRLPLVSGHVRVDMCLSPSSHIFQNGDKMCKAGCFSSSYWSTRLCFSVLLDWKTKDRVQSQQWHYILKHLYQSAVVYPWSPEVLLLSFFQSHLAHCFISMVTRQNLRNYFLRDITPRTQTQWPMQVNKDFYMC